MRFIISLLILTFALISCNKDEFTTAPQIKFKDFEPNNGTNLPTAPPAYVVFEVTDSEGDLDVDSSKIYVRNMLTNRTDSSYRFPSLGSAAGKDFKGDVKVNLKNILKGRDVSPINRPPFTDTLSFEIYVTDKAKNKSNIIIASPFYYTTL